jgi:hypothetical protein
MTARRSTHIQSGPGPALSRQPGMLIGRQDLVEHRALGRIASHGYLIMIE